MHDHAIAPAQLLLDIRSALINAPQWAFRKVTVLSCWNPCMKIYSLLVTEKLVSWSTAWGFLYGCTHQVFICLIDALPECLATGVLILNCWKGLMTCRVCNQWRVLVWGFTMKIIYIIIFPGNSLSLNETHFSMTWLADSGSKCPFVFCSGVVSFGLSRLLGSCHVNEKCGWGALVVLVPRQRKRCKKLRGSYGGLCYLHECIKFYFKCRKIRSSKLCNQEVSRTKKKDAIPNGRSSTSVVAQSVSESTTREHTSCRPLTPLRYKKILT